MDKTMTLNKIIFVTITLTMLFICVMGNAKARPPLNSDFVNGPWARIGKRKIDSCYKLKMSNQIDNKMYIECLKSKLIRHKIGKINLNFEKYI